MCQHTLSYKNSRARLGWSLAVDDITLWLCGQEYVYNENWCVCLCFVYTVIHPPTFNCQWHPPAISARLNYFRLKEGRHSLWIPALYEDKKYRHTPGTGQKRKLDTTHSHCAGMTIHCAHNNNTAHWQTIKLVQSPSKPHRRIYSDKSKFIDALRTGLISPHTWWGILHSGYSAFFNKILDLIFDHSHSCWPLSMAKIGMIKAKTDPHDHIHMSGVGFLFKTGIRCISRSFVCVKTISIVECSGARLGSACEQRWNGIMDRTARRACATTSPGLISLPIRTNPNSQIDKNLNVYIIPLYAYSPYPPVPRCHIHRRHIQSVKATL